MTDMRHGPRFYEKLHVAITKGSLVNTKRYLDLGADPSHKFTKKRQPHGLSSYNYVDYEYVNTPAVVLAATGGHDEIVRLLVERGADVNATADRFRSIDEKNALLIAFQECRPDTVRFLIERGADANSSQRREGVTALAHAIYRSSVYGLDFVRLLIDHGADVNAWDASSRQGRSPLLIACECGQFEIAKLLIEKGADVNAKIGIYGWTPLAGAIERGHVDIAKLLLEQPAIAVNKADVLSLAKVGSLQKRGEFIDLIFNHGEDVDVEQQEIDEAMATALRETPKLIAETITSKVKQNNRRTDNNSNGETCVIAAVGETEEAVRSGSLLPELVYNFISMLD